MKSKPIRKFYKRQLKQHRGDKGTALSVTLAEIDRRVAEMPMDGAFYALYAQIKRNMLIHTVISSAAMVSVLVGLVASFAFRELTEGTPTAFPFIVGGGTAIALAVIAWAIASEPYITLYPRMSQRMEEKIDRARKA